MGKSGDPTGSDRQQLEAESTRSRDEDLREAWQDLEPVLSVALDLPASARQSYLESVCDNEDQLQLVQRLLAAADTGTDFLDRPAASLLVDSSAGSSFGGFSVESLIGRGGMGEVYGAVRSDGEYQQTVAIKVIRADATTGHNIDRFLRERQILADLDHPYIARILDGGTTADGRPYLVMEYVDGISIDRFCFENRLSLEQRVELVRRVSEAVAEAHAKLIVHGDLKPNNVLVTPKGVPRLLDFGIASLASEKTPEEVRGEPVAVTPMWASPEQLVGGPVTTAADVWGLGLLLYFLVTGRLPWIEFAERTGRSGIEWPKPSDLLARPAEAQVESTVHYGQAISKVRRRVTGDLDRILLKAISWSPDDRYRSAGELAEDLRLWSERRPVTAGPDRLSYRFSKFAQRHFVELALAALAGLGLIGLTIFSLNQARVIEAERDRIASERTKAEQSAEFLIDLLGELDPTDQGPEATRKYLLSIEEVLAHATTKIDRLAGQPELQSVALLTIGEIYIARGFWDDAQLALDRALDVRLEIFGEDSPEAMEVHLAQARLALERGEYVVAELQLERIVKSRRQQTPRDDLAIAEAELQLAVTLRKQSRFPRGEELARQALVRRRAAVGDDHPQSAEALSILAGFRQFAGESAEAEMLLERALEIKRRHLGPHESVARDLNDLSVIYWNQGRVAEGTATQREALDLIRQLQGPTHPSVGMAMGNLALMLVSLGELEESEALFRSALEIRENAFGRHSPQIASLLCNLGQLYLSSQRFDEAQRVLEEGRAIAEGILAPGNLVGAHCDMKMAKLALAQGIPDVASGRAQAALDAFHGRFPDDNPVVRYAEAILGASLCASGHQTEGRALLEVAARDVTHGRYTADIQRLYSQLASCAREG